MYDCKNEERSLSTSLESVKKIVVEIIIVDTGSTDKTIKIAKNMDQESFIFLGLATLQKQEMNPLDTQNING